MRVTAMLCHQGRSVAPWHMLASLLQQRNPCSNSVREQNVGHTQTETTLASVARNNKLNASRGLQQVGKLRRVCTRFENSTCSTLPHPPPLFRPTLSVFCLSFLKTNSIRAYIYIYIEKYLLANISTIQVYIYSQSY